MDIVRGSKSRRLPDSPRIEKLGAYLLKTTYLLIKRFFFQFMCDKVFRLTHLSYDENIVFVHHCSPHSLKMGRNYSEGGFFQLIMTRSMKVIAKFSTYELGPSWLTHRVISDRVHRLLVTLSYFRPDRFVQLLSLIPILILLLYYLVSGCLTSLC